MFVGFIFGFRQTELADAARRAAPEAWASTLFTAPTYTDRRDHSPKLDVDAIREILRARAPQTRACVVFAVDMRPADLDSMRENLVYALPRLEIVSIRSRDLASRLPFLVEYYGLVATPRPRDLADALRMFQERHPSVVVLPRATKSAEEAAAFRDPRLALTSLHFVPRIHIDWADARRRDPHRSNHADLRDLRFPARDAFRELMQNAQFDQSDGAGGDRHWRCPDGEKRYFGLHLKWSLGGQRSIDNHCRIHYAVEAGVARASSVVFVGHCGGHL